MFRQKQVKTGGTTINTNHGIIKINIGMLWLLNAKHNLVNTLYPLHHFVQFVSLPDFNSNINRTNKTEKSKVNSKVKAKLTLMRIYY